MKDNIDFISGEKILEFDYYGKTYFLKESEYKKLTQFMNSEIIIENKTKEEIRSIMELNMVLYGKW